MNTMGFIEFNEYCDTFKDVKAKIDMQLESLSLEVMFLICTNHLKPRVLKQIVSYIEDNDIRVELDEHGILSDKVA